MFDLRPADGAGSGEHVAGRHRAAPEPGVYRDVAVHTGAHRLLESEDYRPKVKEIIDGAFGRWRKAGRLDY